MYNPTPSGSFGLALLSGKSDVDGSLEEHNPAGPVLRDIKRCLPLALFSTWPASNMRSTSFYSFLRPFPSIPEPRLKKCPSFLLLRLSGLVVSLCLWGQWSLQEHFVKTAPSEVGGDWMILVRHKGQIHALLLLTPRL